MSSDQYLIEIPGDFLVRALLETALAAFLLLWCLRTRRDGAWAIAGTMSASCWTAVAGFYLLADVLARRGAVDVYSWTAAHGSALDWIRLASLCGVVLALTIVRTRESASADV